MPLPKPSAGRKASRAILFAALAPIFAGSFFDAAAQQSADHQAGARAPAAASVDAATAAGIAAEGELKATIRTFQGDNPSAVYRYYWWHDSCYVRFQLGDYQLVSSEYCRR